MESVAGKAGMLQRYNHYLGNPDSVAQDLDRYLQITKESVLNWAQKTIKNQHRVTVIVKPQSAETAVTSDSERQNEITSLDPI